MVTGVAGRRRPQEDLPDRPGLLRNQSKIPEGAATHLVEGVARQGRATVIPVNDPALAVEHDDHGTDRLEGPELGLRHARRFRRVSLLEGVPVRRPSYPFSALPTTIPPSEVMSYSRNSLLCWLDRTFTTAIARLSS